MVKILQVSLRSLRVGITPQVLRITDEGAFKVTGSRIEFREGDWVKPAFGGRRMTILRLDEQGAVCSWMLGADEQVAWIDFSCLKWCGREKLAGLPEGKMQLNGNRLAH
jgi:hypothetical protein